MSSKKNARLVYTSKVGVSHHHRNTTDAIKAMHKVASSTVKEG